MAQSDTWAVDALLKKEEEANKLIKDAQVFRDQRLKDAKDAAQHEISQFRMTQEQKYQEEIKKYSDSEQDTSAMEQQTRNDIVKINKDFDKNKEAVIEMLIKELYNVDIEIPKTVKSNLMTSK